MYSSCLRSSSATLFSVTFRLVRICSWIRSTIAVTVISSLLSMPMVRNMAPCWRAGRRSSCSSSTKSSQDRLHAASSRNVISAAIGSGGLVVTCGPTEVRWTLVSVREVFDSSLALLLRWRGGELLRTRLSRVSQRRRIDSSWLSSLARSRSCCSRLLSRFSCFHKTIISQWRHSANIG